MTSDIKNSCLSFTGLSYHLSVACPWAVSYLMCPIPINNGIRTGVTFHTFNDVTMQNQSGYTEVAAKNGRSLCKLEKSSSQWHRWETLQKGVLSADKLEKISFPFSDLR